MLDIHAIEVWFDHLHVLRGIDLQVAKGEIVCLLGPSGCGKTTLLRVVAGLETPNAGDVRIDETSIVNTPVHERGFGLMFQDFALFPHLNVGDNAAFGLKMEGLPSAQRQQRVQEVLALVGLASFEKRDVSQLSGGERQRVALARSLAPNPRLLMLDEPLGSLDALLREHLVVELREIIKQVGLTALYVTHDQHEAFAIADRIALMNAGQIEQIGAPEAVYQNPVSPFAARFLGLNNVFPVRLQNGDTAQTDIGTFSVSPPADALLLHPDGIELSSAETGNPVSGIVKSRTFLGDSYRIELQIDKHNTLTFKIPSSGDTVLQTGETVTVSIKPYSVIPLRTQPTKR